MDCRLNERCVFFLHGLWCGGTRVSNASDTGGSVVNLCSASKWNGGRQAPSINVGRGFEAMITIAPNSLRAPLRPQEAQTRRVPSKGGDSNGRRRDRQEEDPRELKMNNKQTDGHKTEDRQQEGRRKVRNTIHQAATAIRAMFAFERDKAEARRAEEERRDPVSRLRNTE